MVYPEEWSCPICSTKNYNSEYCENCSFPKLWICPKCNYENHDGTICEKCGYNTLNPKLSKKRINKTFIIIIGIIIYGVFVTIFLSNFLAKEEFYSRGGVINLPFNVSYFTKEELTNVTIIFMLNNNISKEYVLINNGKKWVNNENITLNQLGDWDVKINKYKNNNKTIYNSIIHIYKECINDNDCIKKDPSFVCDKKAETCKKKDVGMTDFLKEI